jgi:ribonuclease HI
MPLARRKYRNCKVWVEVDEQGQLVAERGLVKVRYRQDAPASEVYSAKATEIGELEASSAVTTTPTTSTPGADPAPPKPRKPRVRKPKATPNAATPSARGGDTIVIHADGSCFGNPGPAGIGVLLEWRGRTKEISRFLGDGTNNIAELTAIEAALQSVTNRRLPVRVHTDSAYAIGVLQEGWKAKENKELVARVQVLMREFPDLRLVKVRGHAGDPGNERVDQLARDAITRRG